MKIYRLISYRNKKTIYDTYFNYESYNQKVSFIELNATNKENIENYLLNVLKIPFEIVIKYKNIKNANSELFLSLLLLYYSNDDCLVMNSKLVIKNDDIFNFLNYDLICVKSIMYNNLFTGFLFSKQNNTFIFNLIRDFNNETINLNDLLYESILKNENNDKHVILNEKIINNISEIEFENKNIATHYFSLNSLDILSNYNVNQNLDLNKIKIGITFDVPNDLISFFSNGIRQNALYLFELLKNMNYDVKLIINNNKENALKDILSNIDFYNYDYSLLESISYDNYNLIFSFGFSIPEEIFPVLKTNATKIVAYMCGNSYIIDSESILYNQFEKTACLDKFQNKQNKLKTYDEIWSIPQMYNQNKYYWEILYRTNCIQIPFIWSSNSIQFTKKILNIKDEKELICSKKNNKVAIFEPNISIMKWCLPCLLICDHNYRKDNIIEHVYVTNIDINKKIEDMDLNKFNKTHFTNVCKGLDIFNDKKMTVEKRYNTIEFINKYAYIAVSHQWENPLNYLYFDLAWLGWPILHNAHLCKDIGYYYNEFNYEEASNKLTEILINHEMNIHNYMETNRKIIDKYLPTNKDLQNKYKQLIENLFIPVKI